MGNTYTKTIAQDQDPVDPFVRVGCMAFTAEEWQALGKPPFYYISGQVNTFGEAVQWARQRERPGSPNYVLMGARNDSLIDVFLYAPSIDRDGVSQHANYYKLALAHRWMSRLLKSPQYATPNYETGGCLRHMPGMRKRFNSYSKGLDTYEETYVSPGGCTEGCPETKHPYNVKDYKRYPKKTLYLVAFYLSGPPLHENILPQDALLKSPATLQAGAYELRVDGALSLYYGGGLQWQIGAPGGSQLSLESDRIAVQTATAADAYVMPLPSGGKEPYALVLHEDGRLIVYDALNQQQVPAKLAQLSRDTAGYLEDPTERDYDAAEEYRRRLQHLRDYLRLRSLLLEDTPPPVRKVHSSAGGQYVASYEDLGDYDPKVDYAARLAEISR